MSILSKEMGEREKGKGRGKQRENFKDGRKSMDNLYLFNFINFL